MSTVRVIRPTESDLRAELAAIYAKYPELLGVWVDRRGECCHGCAASRVADIYGWDVASGPWERVTEIRFLLGEDKRA